MADKNVTLYGKNGSDLVQLAPSTVATQVAMENASGAASNVDTEIKALRTGIAAIDVPEYTVTKAETAENGYSATYILAKDGTQVGEKINIPKDMVVQSGSVKTVTTADTPVAGYVVGDKYVDLVLANSDNSHVYILVSDLVDKTAEKLETARTIGLTGDVTGSGSFDGSSDLSIAATLGDSGVTAGSYGPAANASPASGGDFQVPQITVDAKGRVTAASTRTVTLPTVDEQIDVCLVASLSEVPSNLRNGGLIILQDS